MYSKFALLALLPLLASAAPTKRASGVQISHNNDANQVKAASFPSETERGQGEG
jgi:hypothetical protein